MLNYIGLQPVTAASGTLATDTNGKPYYTCLGSVDAHSWKFQTDKSVNQYALQIVTASFNNDGVFKLYQSVDDITYLPVLNNSATQALVTLNGTTTADTINNFCPSQTYQKVVYTKGSVSAGTVYLKLSYGEQGL